MHTLKKKIKKSGVSVMALIVFLADLYIPLMSGDGRKPNQLFDALTFTLKIYFPNCKKKKLNINKNCS